MPNRRRRVTILAAVLALLFVAGALYARHGGGAGDRAGRGDGGSCGSTLRFRGRAYVARRVGPEAFVQSQAVGVGRLSPCADAPQGSYDVRSLVGVDPAVAIAVPGPANVVYVARGRCSELRGRRLEQCLRR